MLRAILVLSVMYRVALLHQDGPDAGLLEPYQEEDRNRLS